MISMYTRNNKGALGRLTTTKGLLRDRVYEQLKRKIMDLSLEPGRFISEKEAIEMFQVSRTLIREAFIRLSQEELIETIPQKGSFISLIDLQHVEESRFVREQLETAVVRIACSELSGEQIVTLQNLINLQELCVEERNYERLYELDEQFHRTIFIGCRKGRTWEMLERMSTHFNRVRLLRLAVNYDWEIIMSQHKEIVDAIRNREPARAEQAMRDHVRLIVLEKETLKSRYPGYFK